MGAVILGAEEVTLGSEPPQLSQYRERPWISAMAFIPAVHLAYEPPAKRHSMTDLGLDPSRALCDFAVTEPFRLLSDEGVAAVRKVSRVCGDLPRLNCTRQARWDAEHRLTSCRRYSPTPCNTCANLPPVELPGAARAS